MFPIGNSRGFFLEDFPSRKFPRTTVFQKVSFPEDSFPDEVSKKDIFPDDSFPDILIKIFSQRYFRDPEGP